MIDRDRRLASVSVPEPRDPTEQQLRLAVVCYGGLSLAVYMHGVVKELHALVAASRALEDRHEQPFPAGTTELVYYDLLRAREAAAGSRLRAVVDIVSGTSAGGINGVVLAKAIGSNRGQNGLCRLWMERGDFKALMGGTTILPLPVKALWRLTGIVTKRARSLLRGDLMLRWLREALDGIDAERRNDALADLPTLMPDGHSLELFVTATDLRGHPRRARIHDPKVVDDRSHRTVFRFESDGLAGFGPSDSPALAFAATATAAFPGAFPSISIAEAARLIPWSDAEDFAAKQMRAHVLESLDPALAALCDGGVLDNAPFGHAIDAILRKPATTKVDRLLIYIEPHPQPQQARDRGRPSLLETLLSALITIKFNEPILEDLQRVEAFNRRVALINDSLGTVFYDVVAALSESGGDLYGYLARERPEPVRAYNGLKMGLVTDELAGIVERICGYPADSAEASAVRELVRSYALAHDLIPVTHPPSSAQLAFLKRFDLGYTDRRLRFVIRGLNAIWRDLPAGVCAHLKHELYTFVALISACVEPQAYDEPVRERVQKCFERTTILEAATDEGTRRHFVEASDIDATVAEIGATLDRRLRHFSNELLEAWGATTGILPENARGFLRTLYDGFPMWDVLSLPVRAVADVGELDPIQVMRFSPDDVHVLKPQGSAKLKGIALAHFGAFLSRDRRETDYLWGRLDAAERIIEGLLDGGADDSMAAFGAVLDSEEPVLRTRPARDLIADLRAQVGSS